MIFKSVFDVELLSDGLSYSGSKILTQYVVRDYWMCGAVENGEKLVKVRMSLGRPLLNNIFTIFIPTVMLVVISHMANNFEDNYVDMVIQVKLTIILVLSTL